MFIRWIAQYILVTLIGWIAIYRFDSVIRPLYNWTLDGETGTAKGKVSRSKTKHIDPAEARTQINRFELWRV